MSQHTDLSIVPVSVAPSPATSGTTVGVTDANAAYLPNVYPWYAVIKATGQAPTRTNAEIVKVTAGSSAGGITTYTIVRTQGIPATSARTVVVGDDIYDANSAVLYPQGALVGDTDTQIVSGKTLTSPLFQGKVDGWISANETWTYASPSTITVPSGAASKYQKGDRIKWTQTTVKYGVIIAVADTLLTIAVNTDYTVANAAISANYYSHEANPIGYPHWFNFTPTFTGWSTPPTWVLARFMIIGTFFWANFRGNFNSGTSNSTNFIMGMPVTPVSGTVHSQAEILEDNGVRFGPGACEPSNFQLYKNGGLASWTASGTKGAENLSFQCQF